VLIVSTALARQQILAPRPRSWWAGSLPGTAAGALAIHQASPPISFSPASG